MIDQKIRLVTKWGIVGDMQIAKSRISLDF